MCPLRHTTQVLHNTSVVVLGCPRKQTKINFGSNRNKPKQDLFQVCFGLFRETKNKKFQFISVFQTYIETNETKTELFPNKPKQTETTLNFLKIPKYTLF
jgi:hypothetical protein